jgi:hypothetical protein
MLPILAILIAKKAFRDYDTIEELPGIVPQDDEMHPLAWKENVLNMRFFESMSARCPTGKIESATAFSKRLRGLGLCVCYPRPPTIHDFRAAGLFLISIYSNSSL